MMWGWCEWCVMMLVDLDHLSAANGALHHIFYSQVIFTFSGNIYIPTAGAQTPVLVQGEQGHVVMVMTPGTNPYFAIPLNTMSSSHVMCEPTASFKSPIVWNQVSVDMALHNHCTADSM